MGLVSVEGAESRSWAWRKELGCVLIGVAVTADTHLLQAHAEAAENLLHIAALLHGDHAEVVLLIHPHQEAFVVVVPNKG